MKERFTGRRTEDFLTVLSLLPVFGITAYVWAFEPNSFSENIVCSAIALIYGGFALFLAGGWRLCATGFVYFVTAALPAAFTDYPQDFILYYLALAIAFSSLLFLAGCDRFVQIVTLVLVLTELFFEDLLGGYKFFSGQGFSQSQIFALFDTNFMEGFSYIKMHQYAKICILLFFSGSALLIFLLFRRKFEVTARKATVLLTMFILFITLACLTTTFYHERWLILGLAEKSLDIKERFYLTAQKRKQNIQEIGATKNKEFISSLFVVVIGESANRYHHHLYGYFRDTTPNLDRRKNNLIVFDNAIANFSGTVSSLKRALTLATVDSHKEYFDDGMYSIIEILHSAGLKTYWLSNQAKWGLWGLSTAYIVSGADQSFFMGEEKKKTKAEQKNYLETKNLTPSKAIVRYKNGWILTEDLLSNLSNYDEILLPEIARVLQNEQETAVLFVHLMGSHGSYADRYPKSFEKFTSEEDHAVFGDHIKTDRLAAYDNSIFYTDYVLDRIIAVLESLSIPTSLLYFSDHGESVLLGKEHDPTEYSPGHVEVPLFIWYSDIYKKAYPETIRIGQQHQQAPFMLDSLTQVVMDWVHVGGPFYKPERSLLNEAYKPIVRKTLDGEKDYDELGENYCVLVKQKTGVSIGPC